MSSRRYNFSFLNEDAGEGLGNHIGGQDEDFKCPGCNGAGRIRGGAHCGSCAGTGEIDRDKLMEVDTYAPRKRTREFGPI